MKKYTLKTKEKNQFIDITHFVRQYIEDFKILNSKLIVFIPHTTAAVTINENADPDVLHDLLLSVDKFFPKLEAYKHLEGNSPSHFRSSIFGCTQELIVYEGKLILGTWQSIFFCEFDGPRTRNFIISV